MVDPEDFSKNDPPRKDHEQELLKPERSILVVAGVFVGAIVVLLVMLFIAISVL